MFGKEKKQEAQSQAQNVSHIILTTAPEIPSRRYEIVDVVSTIGDYQMPKHFKQACDDLKKEAASIGADAVISMQLQIVNTSNAIHSGFHMAYGTAVKFID